MAEISLHAYYDEIEQMLAEGNLTSAIVHSKYILQTYPKDLTIYRLLGKAYLEARLFDQAEDIFERILSVVPDDLLAHLGLSITAEDAGDLDRSIWHMERAYELAPDDVKLASNLKRLYGRKTGTEPQKLPALPATLVRIHAKAGLFAQALQGIDTILAEDPTRMDLESYKATVYREMGNYPAALKQARKVTDRLPYALEANRILAALARDDEPILAENAEAMLDLILPGRTAGRSAVEADDEDADASIIKLADYANEDLRPDDLAHEVTAPLVAPIGASIREIKPVDEFAEVIDDAGLSEEDLITEEKRREVISRIINETDPVTAEVETTFDDTKQIILRKKQAAEAAAIEPSPEEADEDKVIPAPADTLVDEELEAIEETAVFIDTQTEQEATAPLEAEETTKSEETVTPVAQPHYLELDPADELDQSLLWLQALAVKQGADPSGLLTAEVDPEMAKPAWLTQTAETVAETIETAAVTHELADEVLTPEAQEEMPEQAAEPPAETEPEPAVEIPVVEADEVAETVVVDEPAEPEPDLPLEEQAAEELPLPVTIERHETDAAVEINLNIAAPDDDESLAEEGASQPVVLPPSYTPLTREPAASQKAAEPQRQRSSARGFGALMDWIKNYVEKPEPVTQPAALTTVRMPAEGADEIVRFEELAAQSPDDSTVILQLADAYQRYGFNDEAYAMYKKLENLMQ